MTSPSGWRAATAVSNLPPRSWSGHAWRFHQRRFGATEFGGSALTSGRYHRAVDEFPESSVWTALYVALAPEVALAEVIRRYSTQMLHQLNEYRLSEIDVALGTVLDCRDASALGLSREDLVRDREFAVTQEIAAAAIARGAEAILVPSATQLGDNLIVFPTQLQTTSRLVVVGSRDPRLYIPR